MQVLKSRLAPLTSRITAARLLSSKKDFDIKLVWLSGMESLKCSSKPFREDAIVISGEGVVVAWHPPKSHPYEHSRPIQRKLQDLQDVLPLSLFLSLSVIRLASRRTRY